MEEKLVTHLMKRKLAVSSIPANNKHRLQHLKTGGTVSNFLFPFKPKSLFLDLQIR